MTLRGVARAVGLMSAMALVGGEGRAGAPLGPRALQVGQQQVAPGDWAEVLSVTPKWLVLQNQRGQQFPVSLARENIRLFVIRWPVDLNRISPRAVVEVTGIDLGTNRIRADHLDVFDADAINLVGSNWPAVTRIVGQGTVLRQYTVDPDDLYNGYDFLNSVTGGPNVPDRLHVVAPVAGFNPFRLATGGNNQLGILPGGNGLFMTQVTPGSSGLIKAGDLVYFIPIQAGPKSLSLAQLVVYKRMARDQFVP